MVCLELELNGQKLARGGLPGFAVVTSIVTWVRSCREPEGKLTLSLTGLDSNSEPGEHVGWAGEMLKTGDVVTIRVLESDEADPPLSRSAPGKGAVDRRRAMKMEMQAARERIADLQKKLKALEGTADAKTKRPSQKGSRRRGRRPS